LAGAAIIGGGYYAWHEHEKKKTEEEVSFPTVLSFLTFFTHLLYFTRRREETSPYVGCAIVAPGLSCAH
jgi:hypothetical protein